MSAIVVTHGGGSLCCFAGIVDQTVNLDVGPHVVQGANLGDFDLYAEVATGVTRWHYYPYGYFGVDNHLFDVGTIDLTFTGQPIDMGNSECCGPLPGPFVVPVTMTGRIDIPGGLATDIVGVGHLTAAWLDYGEPFIGWSLTVPEPSTALLLMAGCLLTVAWRWLARVR